MMAVVAEIHFAADTLVGKRVWFIPATSLVTGSGGKALKRLRKAVLDSQHEARDLKPPRTAV